MPPNSQANMYRALARRREESGSTLGPLAATPGSARSVTSQQPFFSGNNRFMQFLDVLNTPQQMIFGGVKGIIEDKPVLESAMQGAREDVQFTDVLETLGMEEGGRLGNMPLVGQALEAVEDVPLIGGIAEYAGDITGRGSLGLLGDIVLDPLLAVGKASRAVGAGDWVMKQGAKAIPKQLGGTLVAETGEGYRKWKSIPFRQMTKGEQEMRTIHENVERMYRGQAELSRKAGVEKTIRIKKRAPEFGLSPAALDRAITKSVEAKSPQITTSMAKLLGRQDPVKSLEGYRKSIKEVEERLTKHLDSTTNISEEALKNAVDDSLVDMVITGATKLEPIPYEPFWMDDPLRKFIFDEAMMMKKNFKAGIGREDILGIGTDWLDDAGNDYILHLLTPEARKFFLNEPDIAIYGRGRFTARHASQLARREDWQGLDIHQLNDLAARGELPGFSRFKGKLMETDPGLIQNVRMIRGLKAEADAKIFYQAAHQLGKTVDDVDAEAWTDMFPLAIIKQGTKPATALQERLQHFRFEPQVAKHLSTYWDAISNPNSPNSVTNFFKGFDAVQKEWKLLTLFPFPAYHTRNFIGNFWNNLLAGVYPGKGYYNQARKFQRTAPDSSTEFTFGGRTQTKAKWTEEVGTLGVSDAFRTFLVLNDPAEVGIEVTEALVGRIPLLGRGVKTGLKIGSAIEDNARLAHYFSKLDEGLAPMDAALSVKKYLFNYAELTPFEMGIMRRTFPFYAWTRFNVPLQIRSAVEKPEYFGALGDIIETVERGVSVPSDTDQILAEWMKENSAVRVRKDDRGNPEFFLLGGWLPAADINRVAGPGSLLQTALDNLGPLKVVPEMAFNYDLFLRRNIEDPDIPGERAKFLGMTLPKRTVIKPLQQLRVLTEIDRLLASIQKTGVLGKTQITNRRGDDLGVHALRTFFGAKLFPFDRQRQLDRLKARDTRLKRRLKIDQLRNAGVNEARIKQLMENPTGI